MSSAAHPEHIVAEGLLSALGDPAGRALESARRLLKDDSLDEAAARAGLEAMIEETVTVAGCPACGHEDWDGKRCASCGHALREADSVADVTVVPQDDPTPKRRKRKRKKYPKVKEAVVEEATSTTPWGGAPFAAADTAVPTGGRDGKRGDHDTQPRVNVPADRVLVTDLTRTVPPNLRDGDGWDRCGNCVFFGKDECNLYGFIRDGETPELVHRGGYPVDVDDVCDAHLTLTPPVARLVEALDREDARLVEAARAENPEMIRRARARVERMTEKLDEAIDATELDEAWSDAARKAAALVRHSHAGVDVSHFDAERQKNHARDMKPGEAAHFGNGVHVSRTDSGYEVHGAGVAKHVTQDPRAAVEHARTRAEGGTVTDHFGSRIAARKPGEGALHYAVRRMQKPVETSSVKSQTKVRRAKGGASLQAAAIADARAELFEVASAAYPGLDRSPKKNWVDKAGGLPSYIERIAKHLHYEKGKEIGTAIAIAVNVVKKMCASGDTNFPGKQSVNPKSRAEACAAVASWEAKKGKSKAKTATKAVEEAAWDDFDSALALTEDAFRPIPPSDRFIESLHRELAEQWGPDFAVGMSMLDEADALIERYAPHLDEMAVTLDESQIVSLLSRSGKMMSAGHWDPLRHPRAPKGRRGGGEFSDNQWRGDADTYAAHMQGTGGRTAGVLASIAQTAKRGAVGGRDSQRGYKHPADAPMHERWVAEMFDRPGRDMSIYPAERKALGSYLRRRGQADFAAKIESGKSRMMSGEEAASLARHVRGAGENMSIFRDDRTSQGGNVTEPRMPELGGSIGKRGIPPSKPKPARYDADVAASVREQEKRRGGSRPSDGGTEKGGDSDVVGRAAATSVEDAFKQDNIAHGRRNESIGGGGAGSVDEAIGNVLKSFPGLHDWNVEKVGDKWHVHVDMPDGHHVLEVDGKGHANYLEGPKKAAVAAAPKKVKAKPKVPAPAPASTLQHQLESLHDFELTGEQEKPYHMVDGQFFQGHDGVLYQKLEAGTHLKKNSKGAPMAAVKIKNHQTGTVKISPSFVLDYYDLMEPKGSFVPKPTQTTGLDGDLYSKLASSIGGGSSSGPLDISGKHFVITGAIPDMTRPQAEAKLVAAGGIKHSSVSNSTDFLITGEGVGKTKTNAAAAKGVKVVPWTALSHLLEATAEDSKLARIEQQLSEATSTAEIVRLRARRDALLESVFDRIRHPRGRAGQFAETMTKIHHDPHYLSRASHSERGIILDALAGGYAEHDAGTGGLRLTINGRVYANALTDADFKKFGEREAADTSEYAQVEALKRRRTRA